MKYQGVVEARFLERPNRFIAYVEMCGKKETVHVKNTGRCAELLVPEARVWLAQGHNPNRKTAYDLIAVEKAKRLINMDSQAPNRAVEEWLYRKELFTDLSFVRPEYRYGNSRFDFYIEAGERKILLEVKGVTLEQENIVRFPDAPSERALKHVNELAAAVGAGYECYVMFVIQMEDVAYFTPNRDTQPAFADALADAAAAGVHILAYDCHVEADSMRIGKPVEVRLSGSEDNMENSKKILRKGDLAEIPKPLLIWYDVHRRSLPWREEPTPYRVWISEIMLQQTRVEAVKPYFERFLQALPDVKSLAEADEELLLKLWEGLGYYSRVRNLQAAARQIMDDYGGQIPSAYEDLLKLKGIGSYTAGAIASIAFAKPVPAVDGNVLRVLSRICRWEEDILNPAFRKKVEQELCKVIPHRAGDFNQAMMEIGAMVCIPNGAPHCTDCPLQEMCLAYEAGVQQEYPKKAPKKPRKTEKLTVLVIRDEERVVLHKRPSRGLLAGMYEFPMLEGHLSREEIRQWLLQKGIKSIRILPLPEAVHIFTHKEWHMKGYLIRVDDLALAEEESRAASSQSDALRRGKQEGYLFVSCREALENCPIPSAFSAYTAGLRMQDKKNN